MIENGYNKEYRGACGQEDPTARPADQLVIPEDLRELHNSTAIWDGTLMVSFAKRHGIPISTCLERDIRWYLIERIAALEQIDAIRKQSTDEVSETLKSATDLVRRITITEVQRCRARPTSS